MIPNMTRWPGLEASFSALPPDEQALMVRAVRNEIGDSPLMELVRYAVADVRDGKIDPGVVEPLLEDVCRVAFDTLHAVMVDKRITVPDRVLA